MMLSAVERKNKRGREVFCDRRSGKRMRRKSFECSRILMEGENNMETVFTSANFDADVLGSEIPVVVDFFATWCGPCRMMAPVIEELAEEYDGKVKIGKLDVDENSDIAARYGVMSIPTIILFKDGEIFSKSVGLQDKEVLKNAIKEML